MNTGRAILAVALAAALGCGDKEDGGGAPAVAGSTAARAVDSYAIHYGDWTEADVALAKTFRLVILHPSGKGVDRALVERIRAGVDPSSPADDVLVLGYVSVGEDLRTLGLSDAQMRADPRFVGDGSGPRVDPRGPDADGGPLEGIDPRGAPSNGGGGFASWYLDDNSVDAGAADGLPDRNGRFGGCFVNAGDPAWFPVVDAMTIDEPGGRAGLREVLTTSHGRGLGCDGVFLDTIDTCGPNSYTTPSSAIPSEFEWTAPGFAAFIRRVRAAYPDRLLLQNRGLFFFDPRRPHYRVTTRGAVDFVFFESFRLDSNAFDGPNPTHYPDNRNVVAPKLLAEAGRPDGFQVLSLGYAVGPGISPETLTGGSNEGLESLLEDIRVTQDEHGFRHSIVGEHIRLSAFVRDHSTMDDVEPPVWSSTANTDPFAAPVARFGVQEVEPGPGRLTVRWDVALDKHRVGYALYWQAEPFSGGNAPDLSRATRTVLVPQPGRGYGAAPGAFPYEAELGGLAPGRTYHLILRAFDAKGNEDRNAVIGTGVPE